MCDTLAEGLAGKGHSWAVFFFCFQKSCKPFCTFVVLTALGRGVDKVTQVRTHGPAWPHASADHPRITTQADGGGGVFLTLSPPPRTAQPMAPSCRAGPPEEEEGAKEWVALHVLRDNQEGPLIYPLCD